MRRSKTQKQIDDNQDEVNKQQDLVNFYQSTALIVYGVCLLGIFLLAFYGGVLK